MSPAKILIKIPTRERAGKFFNVFDMYQAYLSRPQDALFLLTCDLDDKSMSAEEIKGQLDFYRDFYGTKIRVDYGERTTKIGAVNRGVDTVQYPWDILILASDDMLPIVKGYDEIIRKDMETFAPDGDGVLYYPDGYTPLNTLPIMGKKYYKRFHYIYNPQYESFFCDNEFHAVADFLKKQMTSKQVLFLHKHPCNTGMGQDNLYTENDKPWNRDQELFNKRLRNNFDLKIGV